MRRSRALLALIVNEAIAAISGKPAAFAFSDVVVKSKF
jgi:hypothetical protein